MTLSDVIAKALTECMPRGDLTSRHLKIQHSDGGAKLSAREDLILAGREAIETTVRAFAPDAEFGWPFQEGDLVLAGQSVGWIKAPPSALLSAEPLALNLLGRASGIATFTKVFVHEMRGTRAKILCARETTPGLRELEYDAVFAGGAVTPTGDYSNTMHLRSSHVRAVGSISAALTRARQTYQGAVMVECADLGEVDLAVEAKVSRVILGPGVDPAMARARVPANILLEAGGVITPADARALALAHIDFVRVDHLITSAPRAEFTLTLPPAPPVAP